MTMDKPLTGHGVLVTRPEEQAASLCGMIAAAGGTAYRMPLLAIESIPDATQAAGYLSQPEQWDWIIFISANAVRYANHWLTEWTFTPGIAAIGRATADSLGELGIRVDLTPELEFNSESLLALPAMADLTGRKILIVRGRGGREYLGNMLTARGGIVSYAEVYQRALPQIDTAYWRQCWQNQQLHALIVTSGEALDNLHTGLGTLALEWASMLPLAVMGSRIGQLASARGWQRVAVATSATDVALLEAVVTLVKDNQQGSRTG